MKKFITFIFLAIVCTASFAQSVSIATGPSGKGYSKLFANIKTVCEASVPLEEKVSEGGLDNVGILTERGATLGIVPMDVFQKMQNSDSSIGRFKAVAALNNNLFHILTNSKGVLTGDGCKGKIIAGKCIGMQGDPIYKQINTQADLKGLNVGLVGSAQLTGRTYINTAAGGFNAIDFNGPKADSEAQAALAQGKIDALITTSAWPSGAIKDLTQSSGFSVVAWTAPPTNGYKVIKKNYKKLNALGVPFLASTNTLFARPVDPASDVGQNITKLKSCIQTNLSKLKTNDGFEPSWDEVDSLTVSDELSPWGGVTKAGKK